jgi:uncharacterized protein YjbJ (UPF0337 family)
MTDSKSRYRTICAPVTVH